MARLEVANLAIFTFKEGSCYVKRKVETGKTKDGLARCMELASDRKGLVFLAAVLSSLAAIASFIPYIAVYFMIRSIIGVFPNLDQLDMGMVMNYGWLALAGLWLISCCIFWLFSVPTWRRSVHCTS